MSNFYDQWLGYWDEEREERAKARMVIHEEELEWVRTKQDYRAALVCSRLNGFLTAGDMYLGEIPKGWFTGQHYHGEEAIYIIEGQGCSVVDGKRYDWEKGSCLYMPFGAVHQHFNTGDQTVRYLSGTSLTLERFVGLAKLTQLEEAGEMPMGKLDGIELAESDIHPEYGRIVLRARDARVTTGAEQVRTFAARKDEFYQTMAKEMKTEGKPSHHAGIVQLMHADSGFKSREINMTGVQIDEPYKPTGKHAHMEAILYVLQGDGYTIVDGETVPWKKGSLIQIPGPQSVHQHFVTGEIDSHKLRIHYGIRSHYYQATAKRMFPYLYYEYSGYEGSAKEG